MTMKKVPECERAMRAVPLCGTQVIKRLRSIGIFKLSDLRNKNPQVLMHQVNHEAGKVIWRPPMAIRALRNLIAAANRLPQEVAVEEDPP
jgi:predicted RNA-binding protein YlqC (UPF0109 family)